MMSVKVEILWNSIADFSQKSFTVQPKCFPKKKRGVLFNLLFLHEETEYIRAMARARKTMDGALGLIR